MLAPADPAATGCPQACERPATLRQPIEDALRRVVDREVAMTMASAPFPICDVIVNNVEHNSTVCCSRPASRCVPSATCRQ
jgi:hypothetical protein